MKIPSWRMMVIARDSYIGVLSKHFGCSALFKDSKWKLISTQHITIWLLLDGTITNLTRINDKTAEAIVFIENISPLFVGFKIDPELVFFNVKSTLAQLGLDGVGVSYELDAKNRCAQVKVSLNALGQVAQAMLSRIQVGASIGKLFAADNRRGWDPLSIYQNVWQVRQMGKAFAVFRRVAWQR